ncbi:MAG: S8 family serine peptidase [Limisphaerales bacterium]
MTQRSPVFLRLRLSVSLILGLASGWGSATGFAAEPNVTDPRPSGLGTRRAFVTVHVELEGEPTAALAANRRGVRLADTAPSLRAAASRLMRQQESLQAPVANLGGEITARFTRVAHAIRVRIPHANLPALEALPGVRRVRPVRLYSRHLAINTPFVGATSVWSSPAPGFDGRGLRIGIIDSGIDYTHADFGGGGKVADFTGNDPTRIEPGSFPTAKVVGGFDFAGDAYNPNDDAHETPIPDKDPLDCAGNGHGTHVAGIAAGLGVLADGSTFVGKYSDSLDFDSFSVAPGIAPGASLYALKVFGCAGSTALVTDALEWAADPNQDHDFSDRLDVVNLSLGGDFGTFDPEDTDLQAANRLAELGCVVVCSAGNGDNIFFAVGAPGVADRAISVANSISKGLGKALAVLEPEAIAGRYFMVDGSLTPPLTNSAPLSARLVPVEPNLACEDLANSEALRGNIALIDRGTCFFADKILRAQAAGAIAVVMVNNTDSTPISMGGDPAGIRIPGVMVSKADGAILRRPADETVILRLDPELTIERVEYVDTLDDSSSRGPGSPGSALKPDISAPGAGIVSANAGSGTGSVSLSGTSMSSPMVAGAAALLRQRHPEWTVEEIKAALMNTARPLVSPEGVPYPESRMGAGRLRLAEAIEATVTAAAVEVPGRVSLDFGAWNVSGPREERRTVRLTNHGIQPVSFRIAFSNSVAQPGMTYIPVDASITVPAGGTATTAVRLLADPTEFDPQPDGTTAAEIGGGTPLPRQFLYEASGQLWFHADDQSLHVPCYANARAASDYQALDKRIRIAARDSTQAQPELTLRFAGNSPSPRLIPIVSAFELGETSPDKRITDPNRAAADLLAVGAATDIASVSSFADASVYFGIATASAWSTPQSEVIDINVLIDVNGDGWEDFGVFNGNGASTNSGGARDAFLSVVYDLGRDLQILATNAVANLNGFAADELETGVFNNSVMVLPVPVGAIGLTRDATTFRYRVFTYATSGLVDRTSWIPFDADRPVIDTAFSTPDGMPFHDDGAPVRIRLDREAAHETGQRLPAVLLLHHLAADEGRMEIVTLDLEGDDTDDDRLPDWWEQRLFSGLGVAGRETDFDGDGASDHSELVAGTDPKDSRSVFRMRSASRVSSRNISVRWSGIAGQVFTLERSTNLTAGFTEIVRDDIASTPPLNSITDTNAPNPGPYFYRARLKR